MLIVKSFHYVSTLFLG